MFTRRRESHLLQTVGATVIGMSAGVILGMLIAPKQGKEIRNVQTTFEFFRNRKKKIDFIVYFSYVQFRV